LGDKFEKIENMYAAANKILGNVVKVTPTSKAVGDLALALVGAKADPAEFEADPSKYDIPDSVIAFLNGELGDPPGGWPEPFRTRALQGRKTRQQISDLTAQDTAALAADPRNTLNRLLFPGPSKEYASSRESYSDLSVLSTGDFLHGLEIGTEYEVVLEPGKRLLLGVQSVSEPDERGLRTVMCTVNGQLRPVQVRDVSVAVDVRQAERADVSASGQVAAPFAGVVSLGVEVGQQIDPGATIATIEAMKMEATITSPVGGTVERLAIGAQQQVEGGDLLIVVS
jgi:pyruvate carboxylase